MVSPEMREKIIACNRSFHDRFAASYDGCYKNHTGEPQFFEKLTSELAVIEGILAEHRQPVKALDCGVGTGYVTVPLLERGYRVTGVDLSGPMLEVCRRKTDRFNTPPRLIQAELEEFLSTDAGQYDLVVYCSMLHHLPDYLHTLRLTLPRIAPGGLLHLTVEPCLAGEQGWGGRFLFQIEIALDRLLHEPGDVFPAIGRRFKRFLGRGPDRAESEATSEEDETFFAEYHSVTGGVDSEAIARLLGENGFELLRYEKGALSSYAPLRVLKRLLRSKENFWILARKPPGDS